MYTVKACLPSAQTPIFGNVSLSDKNWFKTGGLAQYFIEPLTANDFSQALIWAEKNRLPIFVLGQGANVLISDDGFQGMVIRPHLQDITTIDHNDQVYVTAGSGVVLHDLIEWCLEHNISGLEEFSGIPGTVGGSVYINLHYYEFLFEHFLVSGQVICKKTGAILNVDKNWFAFNYNTSTLQAKEYYLSSATFCLKRISDVATAYAQGRRTEIIRHRARRYPTANTCGSFFRNFLPHEVSMNGTQKPVIHVAYYLDKVGIKGELSHNDAIVSWQHANMIVNKGAATTTDIITIARQMQELVHKKFGLLPQPECELVGFNTYPLHTHL